MIFGKKVFCLAAACVLSLPLWSAQMARQHAEATAKERAFIEAAERGDLEAVKKFLSGGVFGFLRHKINVNAQRENGDTALIAATINGHFPVVQALLARPEIDINIQRQAWTAFMYAVYGKYNERTEKGESSPAHLSIVRALLARREVDVNSLQNGVTVLMWAVQYGYQEITKALLAWPDIDINIQATQDFSAFGIPIGSTALIVAAGNGHLEIVKALLAHPQINVNARTSITAMTRAGWTAFMCAASKGHFRVMQALLEHPNIDVNVKDMTTNKTALGIAVQYGHSEIPYLLIHHPRYDEMAEDTKNAVLLLEEAAAVSKRFVEQRDELKKVKNGFLEAARSGNLRRVQEYLARPDIDVNARDTDGDTALMTAAYSGNLAVVQALLADRRIDSRDAEKAKKFLRKQEEEKIAAEKHAQREKEEHERQEQRAAAAAVAGPGYRYDSSPARPWGSQIQENYVIRAAQDRAAWAGRY